MVACRSRCTRKAGDCLARPAVAERCRLHGSPLSAYTPAATQKEQKLSSRRARHRSGQARASTNTREEKTKGTDLERADFKKKKNFGKGGQTPSSAARPTRVRLRHFSHQSPGGQYLISIHHLTSLPPPTFPVLHLHAGVLDQYQVCSSLQCLRLPRSRSCSQLQDVHAAQAASRWTTWRKPNEAVTSSQKLTTSGTTDASASQRSRRRKLNRRTQWSSSCSALARSRHRRADIGTEHTNTHLLHSFTLILLRDQKMNYVRPNIRNWHSSRSRPSASR